jgi:hypothetical protein
MNRLSARVQERRHRVAAMYLQGKNQYEIAALLHLTQQQISLDLQYCNRQWQAAQLEATEARKAQQLAELALLRREAWAAWVRSQAPKEITATEATEGGTTTRKASVRKEEQVGDPRFLAEIRGVIETEAKIAGTFAPTHIKFDPDTLSTDQLRRLAMGEPLDRVMQGPGMAEA